MAHVNHRRKIVRAKSYFDRAPKRIPHYQVWMCPMGCCSDLHGSCGKRVLRSIRRKEKLASIRESLLDS